MCSTELYYSYLAVWIDTEYNYNNSFDGTYFIAPVDGLYDFYAQMRASSSHANLYMNGWTYLAFDICIFKKSLSLSHPHKDMLIMFKNYGLITIPMNTMTQFNWNAHWSLTKLTKFILTLLVLFIALTVIRNNIILKDHFIKSFDA